MIRANIQSDWPFSQPTNEAVFTTADVMNGTKPILFVAHDVDDGAWQFMSGDTFGMEDAKVLALHEIVEMDPTVRELSDLPEGWAAQRRNRADTWRRFKQSK